MDLARKNGGGSEGSRSIIEKITGNVFLKEISKYLIIAAAIGIGISYWKIYLFHIVLVPFLLAVVFNKKLISDALRNIKTITFYHFFAVLFLWYALSIICSADKIAAIYYLAYLTMGISVVLAFKFAADDVESQMKIVKILGIVFIIEIIVSFLEGVTGFRYPISPYSDLVVYFGRPLGYDKDLPVQIIELLRKTPTGFRWNPNDLAVTMLIVLPFFIFHRNFWIRFLGIIAITDVIFFTGSRAVYFSLIFVVAGYFIFFVKRQQILKHLAGTVLLLFAIFLNLSLLKSNFYTRFLELTSTVKAAEVFVSEDHEKENSESSISIRQNLIKNGITALLQTYGVGVGGGNSNRIHSLKGMKNTHNITSMHNFWIEILVEGGVLIFILTMIWYVAVFFKLYFISRKTSNSYILYFARAGGLSMIGFFVGVISLSSAIYFFPMWLLFGFNLATINNYEKSLG